jgi:DHA2 family multidrug resistance protein
MSSIYPGIDFHTAVLYRIYQAVGLAFLFVPINTISFVNIPPSQGNQVSALVNLCRNLGGSIGISAFSTILARRGQVHQTYLAAHTTATNIATGATMVKGMLFRAGTSLPDAVTQADGRLYLSLQQQATALAYIDVIRIFAVACMLALPLLLFARRNRPGGMAMAH